MYLLIIFLPLISSLFVLIFGRLIGEKGSELLTSGLVILCSILSWILFYEVGFSKTNCYLVISKWIDSELLLVNWGFQFDILTVTMLIVVTNISSLVHIYSIEYMENDPHKSRFMSYLSLFTFFMLILITADNYVVMFLGWEGVGLSSYLLINFWSTRLEANKSAMKAMIVNRIGDFGLSLGIFGLFSTFKSVDYSTIFAISGYYVDEKFLILNWEYSKLTIICFLLLVGAIGKSAQIGLHTWLPDAMEGPTPVSALIHAATMVTAGVFLIIRSSALFEYAPNILLLITLVGGITAFFGATTAMVQNDLKRVIAYSTCSQLGYMIFACGISNYGVSLFHLVNHAFFKALLFLSAGCVIHALNDEQDMRKMGGLINKLPLTYIMMLIGSLSLMGLPFLTGFYSKDIILELSYGKYTINGSFVYWLGSMSAFFTSFYSLRLLYLTFINDFSGFYINLRNAHEPKLLMTLPLIILSFGSIFIGYITKDLFIGLGSDFFNNSIWVNYNNMNMLDSEFLPYYIKLIPVLFSLMGGFLSIISYLFIEIIIINFLGLNYFYKLKLNNIFIMIYSFLNKKWYFDKFYNDFIVKLFLNLGYNIFFKSLDRGLLEILGPVGIINILTKLKFQLKNFQSGNIYHYALVILIGVCFFCLLFLNLNNIYLLNYKFYFIFIICILIINIK